MFLVLRVVAVIAAIYWLSPLREDGPIGSELVSDRTRALLAALETLPPGERAEALRQLVLARAKISAASNRLSLDQRPHERP
jgi:hypothetical protein